MAKRWFIVHAYSNCESKVADSIREQAEHRHLDHLFEEIIVPIEKLVEVRHSQKHATERKFFPGYVLAKVELTDEAYHLIKNTPKVNLRDPDETPEGRARLYSTRIRHAHL